MELLDKSPGGVSGVPAVATADGRWPLLRAGLCQRIIRHNPAYLVSAVLMIAGVYTVIRPGNQDLGNLLAILATFSTLQVYELLLVGIALYLVCLRRVVDDGATLVVGLLGSIRKAEHHATAARR